MKQVMIWRDQYDKEVFYIGTHDKHGYTQYVSCFLDGVIECFGLTKEEAAHVTTKPQAIRLVTLFHDPPGEEE